MKRRLPVAKSVMLGIVVALAGCSPNSTVPTADTGQSSAGAEASPARPAESGMVAGPPLPACVRAAAAVPPPEAFPEDLPLPPGTVITAARMTAAGAAYIDGYAPLSHIDAARFFLEEMPAAGYVNGRGDSESHEAEAPFSGNGVDGRWIVVTVPDCPAATYIVITTAAAP